MAATKQHAAIDLQGAANITIAGSAGSSGQVLTSGGSSSAMTWETGLTINDSGSANSDIWSAAKIISNGLAQMALPQLHPVKVFKLQIDWGNSTQTGCTYPVGSDPDYDGIIDIEHGLDTENIICSIMDLEGVAKAARTQFDMNYDSEVTVKVVDEDNVRITFAHTGELGEGDGYVLSIIGIT
jgi:hypothetical protein